MHLLDHPEGMKQETVDAVRAAAKLHQAAAQQAAALLSVEERTPTICEDTCFKVGWGRVGSLGGFVSSCTSRPPGGGEELNTSLRRDQQGHRV